MARLEGHCSFVHKHASDVFAFEQYFIFAFGVFNKPVACVEKDTMRCYCTIHINSLMRSSTRSKSMRSTEKMCQKKLCEDCAKPKSKRFHWQAEPNTYGVYLLNLSLTVSVLGI